MSDNDFVKCKCSDCLCDFYIDYTINPPICSDCMSGDHFE